jgi:DNA-directed RNA polymerase subunit omega
MGFPSAPRALRLKGANMARVTVEDCLEKVDNRFLLVMLAAKRVKQLYKGAKPLIDNRTSNKNVVISLREIAAGKVGFELTSRKGR